MRCPKSVANSTSRRSFLRYAALAAATPILTEAHFAFAAQQAAGATAPAANTRRTRSAMPVEDRKSVV